MEGPQSWFEVPSIAHFCSLFRVTFSLLDFDIEELEEALLIDGTDDTCSLLQDLVVRLLSGCLNNPDITTSNYQMYLRRLFRHKCQEERRPNPFDNDIDFHFLPSRTKTEILYDLCEYRLAVGDAYEALKNLEAESLRVKPLGCDRHKSTYWYFYGTRLYKETLLDQSSRSRFVFPSKTSSRHRLQKLLGFPLPRKTATHWGVVCSTAADWTSLCDFYTLSSCSAEKSLCRTLKEDFLPELPYLFAEKNKERRKRALNMASKRVGSRSKHRTHDDDDFDKKPDKDGKKARFDDDEWAALRNNADRATRALLREISRDHSADSQSLDSSSRSRSRAGSVDSVRTKKKNKKHKKHVEKSHLKPPKAPSPPKSSHSNKDKEKKKDALRDSPKKSKAEGKAVFKGRKTNNSLASAVDLGLLEESSAKEKAPKTSNEGPTGSKLRSALSKIMCLLRNHPDAWPFLDPVDEDYAPDYYRMVSQPMDLERMEAKLHTGQYNTAQSFRDDFQLIVSNCRIYNGPESEYCGMVESLKKEFGKLVMKYLDIKEEEEADDEEEEELKKGNISPVEDEPDESMDEERVKDSKRAKVDSSIVKLVKKNKKKKKSHDESARKTKDRGKKHKVAMDSEDAWNTPEESSENERDLKALATKRKAKVSESHVLSDSETDSHRTKKTKAEKKVYEKDSGSASRAGNKVNGTASAKRKEKLPVKSRAAINALTEATEQTLKDINKWLDETPKFSELSPSTSPKAAVTAEEFESIASSIESQYRKSLNADKPKLKAKALKNKQKGLLVLAGAGKRAKLLAEAEKRDRVSEEEEREEHVKKKKKDEPSKPKEKEKEKDKEGVNKPVRELGANSSSSTSRSNKDINRTIERMQLAGKNKLGTLAKVTRPDESKLNSLIAKAKESRDLKNPPTTETALTPKLSLGTVLTSDIGMSTTKLETDVVVAAPTVPEEPSSVATGSKSPPEEPEKVVPAAKSGSESPEGEDPTQPGPIEIKQGKATPNLSAWFKAFGAPKGGMAAKKKPEAVEVKPTQVSPPKPTPPPPNLPKPEKTEKFDLPWYSKLDKKDSPAKTLWGNLEKDDFPNFLPSSTNPLPAATTTAVPPNPATTLPFPKRSKDDEEGARRLLSFHQGHMEPSPADSGSGGSPANSPAFGGSEGERSPMTPTWAGRNGSGTGPNPSPASSDLAIRSPATPDMGSPYAPPVRVGFYQDMSQKTAPSPSPVNSIKSPAPSPHPVPVVTTKASPVLRNHPSPISEPPKPFVPAVEPIQPQYRPLSAASQLSNQPSVVPTNLPSYNNPPVLNKTSPPVEMAPLDDRVPQPGYPLKKRLQEELPVNTVPNLAPMTNPNPYGYPSNTPSTCAPIGHGQGAPSVNSLPGNLASLSQIVARIPTTDPSSSVTHIGSSVSAPVNRNSTAPAAVPVNTSTAPSYTNHAFLNPPAQNQPNLSSNAYGAPSQQGYQRVPSSYAPPSFPHYNQVAQNVPVRTEGPRASQTKAAAQPPAQQPATARLPNDSNYSGYQQNIVSQPSQWPTYDGRSTTAGVPTQAENLWNRHAPTYSNASVPSYPAPAATVAPTTYSAPSNIAVAVSRGAVTSSQPVTLNTATATRVSTNQNHAISTLASNPHLWPPASTSRAATSAAPSQLSFSHMGYEHMMSGSLLFSGLDPLTANHSMFRSGLAPPPGSGGSRSSPWAPPSLSFETSTASTSSTAITSLSLPTAATGTTTVRNEPSRSSSSNAAAGAPAPTREPAPPAGNNPFDPAQRTAPLSGSAFNYSAAMPNASSDTLAASLYGRHPQRTLQQSQTSTSPGLARPQGMHPQPGSGNPLLTGLGGSSSPLTRPVPHSYLGPSSRPGNSSTNSQTLPPPPAHQGYPQQSPHPSHGSLLSHPGFGTPSLPMTSPFGDFLGSGQSLPPGAHPLADPSSPFYQQLLQRQQHEELLLRATPHPHSHPMLQPGLLGSASYPPGFTPGLGLQQSFQGWL